MDDKTTEVESIFSKPQIAEGGTSVSFAPPEEEKEVVHHHVQKKAKVVHHNAQKPQELSMNEKLLKEIADKIKDSEPVIARNLQKEELKPQNEENKQASSPHIVVHDTKEFLEVLQTNEGKIVIFDEKGEEKPFEMALSTPVQEVSATESMDYITLEQLEMNMGIPRPSKEREGEIEVPIPKELLMEIEEEKEVGISPNLVATQKEIVEKAERINNQGELMLREEINAKPKSKRLRCPKCNSKLIFKSRKESNREGNFFVQTLICSKSKKGLGFWRKPSCDYMEESRDRMD